MLTEAQAAFFEKVHPEPNSGCWLWTGGTVTFGYGCIDKGYALYRAFGSVGTTAHRIAYLLFKGEIPKGKFVCHKCDTAPCVNPDHLFLGTQLDNLRDMIKKGRRRIGDMPKGEDSWNAKLTEKDVAYIRRSGLSRDDLAKKFGVSDSTIRSIRARKSWKHIP